MQENRNAYRANTSDILFDKQKIFCFKTFKY